MLVPATRPSMVKLWSFRVQTQVKVTCESGCSCKEVVMDARNQKPTSELHTQRMPISPHPE